MSTSPETLDAPAASKTELLTGSPILDTLLAATTEVTLEDLGDTPPVNPALATGFGEYADPPKPEDTVITAPVAAPDAENAPATSIDDPEATDTFAAIKAETGEAPTRLPEGIGGTALFAPLNVEPDVPAWPADHQA